MVCFSNKAKTILTQGDYANEENTENVLKKIRTEFPAENITLIWDGYTISSWQSNRAQ